MSIHLESKKKLGINGIGRIGKLTLWNHLSTGHFESFVLNTGRRVGRELEDVIDYLLKDSTYGSLDRFLYGYSNKKCSVQIIDREAGLFAINDRPIKVLMEARNPRDINWARETVQLVVECTGAYIDPADPAGKAKGSARGHLEAGAEKVIVSAPFKISDNAQKIPDDSGMFVYGINHVKYDPSKHHIISAASCTTTGLAHMVKPLLETRETSEIVTASMSTVHAATNNQKILDTVPRANDADLRRNRSVFNNIILTTTGAANALEEIIPEIKVIGFMADSVRVPISTSSLIMLNVTFKTFLTETGEPLLNRNLINDIYRKAAAGAQKDMLVYSDKQNVSSDLAGFSAAIVIEGIETHTRTGFIPVNATTLRECGLESNVDINIPVTHAKIFGWYDNELGSYVNFLGKLTIYVDKNMP
ncbi:MAG: glyceraldehyde 3-phosphate dehydrogenase NAD-binding domain-containing protein [Bacillota bacterium]|nr:glyceraldehyde 3-phosphate dehydrogenase NAD-binding domain-containing protein [Bacillota bacterium]